MYSQQYQSYQQPQQQARHVATHPAGSYPSHAYPQQAQQQQQPVVQPAPTSSLCPLAQAHPLVTLRGFDHATTDPSFNANLYAGYCERLEHVQIGQEQSVARASSVTSTGGGGGGGAALAALQDQNVALRNELDHLKRQLAYFNDNDDTGGDLGDVNGWGASA